MYFTSPRRSKPESYCSRRPQCELQRIVPALGLALLACLPASRADAKQQAGTDFGMDRPALEAPPTNEDSFSVDTSSSPVTIEGQRLYPDSAPDSLERNFHDALGPPTSLIVSERRFTDGAIELTTRFGRFCAKPLPGYLQSHIEASMTVVGRCASY
jgi:hypothetical protein